MARFRRKVIVDYRRRHERLISDLFRSHIVEVWMSKIERSMADVQNADLPLEQYTQLVNKFKVCLFLSFLFVDFEKNFHSL